MHDSARPFLERPAPDFGLLAEVRHLWDELADFGAGQSGQAVARLMAFVCDRVEGWNATWSGAITAPPRR